jgi:uncharacterized protein (UPF0276 family)
VRPLTPWPSIRPLIGCGFRPPLLGALFGHLDLVEVWEHTADWYLGDDAGRRGATELRSFASTAPVALHCLTLSIGSPDCLSDVDRLEGVGRLAAAAGVDHVSDHLAISRVGSRPLPHFVPLWRTEEQLDVVIANVTEVQERIGVRLVLENPAMMLDPGGEIATFAFLNEVSRRTGCGVLLDLENLRVNEANGRLDAGTELAELDLAAVVGVHLAGGTLPEGGEPAGDTHDQPVSDPVLRMLESLLPDLSNCKYVIVERDGRFDEGSEVLDDLQRLHALLRPARGAW